MDATLAAAWQHLNGWELLAVVLGLAYLLLAMREDIRCWYAGFFSTLIYLFLFWEVGLLMESALQVYYLAMAVYGWWHWRGGRARAAGPLEVRTWAPLNHACAIAAVLLASGISGYLLTGVSGAAWPYLDSLATWGSVLATWMVARKLLENWLYWIVIDSVSLGLYLERGLYLTAVLFALYLLIAVFGFIQWRQHFREQHPGSPAQSAG